MEQRDYHSSITANVTPAAAFSNIANVGAWWTKSFNGRATNAGDTFTVQFGETKVSFEVIDAIPDKKMVWKVTDAYLHWLKDKTEWNNTTIVWEISSENDMTRIDMTHVGITPDVECYESCTKGWDQYVKDSLLKLLTEGTGRPD